MRARARWITSGAAVALAAALVLSSGSSPATATQNQAVLAGSSNSQTYQTEMYDSTYSPNGCGGTDLHSGAVGCGTTGVAGYGSSNGVFGTGPVTGVNGVSSSIGVYGHGDYKGVEGTTQTGTGVFGNNIGATGIGVWGQTNGSGTGVYGEATGNSGVAVFGDTTNGVGVQARSTNGPALNVIGRAAFSNTGIATVASTKSSVTVTGVSLTSSSLVLATIQGNLAARWVRGVSLNIGAGSFTIYLNKPVNAATFVGWFIVD